MESKNMDSRIAYQNKDIVSKLFGQQMKGKSLSLFGWKSDLKVTDARPTNIPIVQAREGIAGRQVTDEVFMHLVLLPLT